MRSVADKKFNFSQKTTISSVDTRKSDEERMLDSGHYELAEARRRAAQIESVSLPRHTKLSTHTEIIVQPIISPYRFAVVRIKYQTE